MSKAEAILEKYNYGPLFTPLTLDKPTIIMPGYGGGANWPGSAVDPETGILYVPSNNTFAVTHFYAPGDLYGDQASLRILRGAGWSVKCGRECGRNAESISAAGSFADANASSSDG